MRKRQEARLRRLTTAVYSQADQGGEQATTRLRPRWAPGPLGTAALLAVALLIAVVAVVVPRYGVADDAADGTVAGVESGQSKAGAEVGPGSIAEDGAGGTASGATGSAAVVHVIGAVKNPGVVELAPGARVQDALAAAGGALPTAQVEQLNLARKVQDGERIWVPAPGLKAPPELGASGGSPSGAGGNGGSNPSGMAGGGGGSAGNGSGGLVNINTADATALQTIPGIGPALAQRILDYRQAHGQFRQINDLEKVPGIGPKTVAKLRPHVQV